MLVLSRKSDETIVIAGDIRITVLSVKGNRVRIGIEAPRDMPIRRSELTPLARATKPPTAPEPQVA